MDQMQSAQAIAHTQATYWRNRSVVTVGCASLIEHLAVDRPAPGPRRHRVAVEISEAASTHLLRIAGGADLAAYLLFVTLFKATAARFTGEPVVTVLSPAYRSPGAAARPGATQLVLQDRVDLAAGLKHNGSVTQRTVIGAYSNQDHVPAELAAPSLLAHHAVIACEALHGAPLLAERSPFAIHLARRGAALAADLVVDPDVVDPRLAEQFARQLAIVIDRSSRDPASAFGDLDWLAGDDAAQLERLAQGAVGPIEGGPLHALFVTQAGKTPAEVAVIFDGKRVTYRELDELSDRIARGLVAQGVVPGDLVVLLCSRSVEMVAAMLAVGKAGAAFVPVGTDLPEVRVRAILDQAAPRCVLTNLARNQVPGMTRVVRVAEARWSSDATALPRDLAGSGVAYAIFTSGSTGEPRGVLVEHRGIVNAVTWRAAAHQLAPGHRFLQLFAYSFDGFILTLFAALAAGATTVLVRDDEARVAPALVRQLRSHAITHTCLAPALLQGILEDATAADLASLVSVTVAGDVTRRRTVELWRSLRPGVTLCNEYGPTEGSVVATFHPDLDADAVAVIGRPIRNVGVQILDAALRPVPPGVFGQIALAGSGLARGYLNDPARTAERFVTWRDQRIYLTGDLGRWRSDGSVEFRGRCDDQIKLRGYRVELEDVRRQVLSCEGVKEAVVFADGSAAQAALVACFTEVSPVDRDRLLDHLRARLPDYMVPAEVILLGALPLTDAGKYDLGEIRARARSERARRTDDLPATDTERRLAAIWAALLDLDQVAVTRSFFALGGHSLKATRLLARIQAELGVTLPLEAVFRSNTIRTQAALIDASTVTPSAAIPSLGDRASYPLSPAQERMLVLAADDALQLSYSVPAVFEVTGDLDVARLERAVQDLVARHPGLRTYFVWDAGQVTQAIAPACAIAVRRHTRAAGEDLATVLRGLATRFDLARVPLLAVTVLDGPDSRHLAIEFHHVVVDEISVGILFRELELAYNGVALGPAPGLRYVDYAAWQRERKAAPAYAAQLAYWQAKLAGARLGPVALPFEPGADPGETGQGRQHVVALDAPLARAIRALCERQELTLFMFFAGSFAACLHHLAGQDEIVIGSPTIERSRPETAGVVGLFLNTLLLCYRFDDRVAIGDFLHSVKRELLRDLANAEVQLEDLVKCLPAKRSVDSRAVFNVMISIVDGAAETLQLGAATARAIDHDTGTAKFDLLLEVHASNGADDVRLVLEYARDRLSAARVEALGRVFVALLGRIVAAPETSLAALGAIAGGEAWHGERPAASAANAERAPARPPEQRGPSSALEHELARTWAQVLKLAPAGVGVDDSFFQLGGDSLAMTVIAKTIRGWGYPVRLRQLFANDTIAKLGALLAGMPPDAASAQNHGAGDQPWKQS
jgi:amino acid adenylation domain-containing protein